MFCNVDILLDMGVLNLYKEVYVIIFYFGVDYVCGVIVIVYSICKIGFIKDFVIFVDSSILFE